ncbi:MAG: SDR family oxidoreductase UcpA [Clostridiales Family XIII bacterium]|jgi:NAD(P)-dependent dehydrogenase (short-subunit alcohol dehydrogenase family)|nr:SDR family oxidoreductase UcpA [Clostridiales Family XIII bacterium]
MTKKLENKVAFVTGAAMGNGLGAATVLARHGAIVNLVDVNPLVSDSAEKLRGEGLLAESHIGDVTDIESIRAVAKKIVEKYGKIDILVNNAGVANIIPFLELSDEIRDRMFDINIKGVWNCSKAILPYMIENHYGKIVNMSSVTGTTVVDPGETAYGTTKAAIWGFTKALAIEVAKQNITVNAICPGYILTPMVQGSARETDPANPQRVIDGIAAGIPMERLGTTEELGDLVAFLSSDESRYITGTQIVIDGGSTLPESGSMGHH